MLPKRPRTCSSDGGESAHQSSISERSVVVTKDKEQVASILAALDTCRNNRELCDVVLCVEDQEFPAHKVILASSSPYFKAMFTSGMAEAARNRVTMTRVTADQLRAVLDYLYAATISITDSNVESILYAADYLQVAKLKDMCCTFLKKRLGVTNCLRIGRIAEDCACSALEKDAMKLAQNANWDELMLCDEFLELSAGKLTKLLSSDNLNIKREEDLFEAAVNWLNHRPEERTQGFEEILKHIRLPLMSPYYLLCRVAETPAVTQNEQCRQLLEDAKYAYMLPDRRRECSLACTTLRNSSLMVPAAILVGGHDGRRRLRDVDCFVPSHNTWLSLAELPYEVIKHGVAAIDQNSLLLAGGEYGDILKEQFTFTMTSAAWRFNPALNTWCKAAPMILTRRRVSLAALDGFVYAVGAPACKQEKILSSVERYNPVVNEWDLVKDIEVGLLIPPKGTLMPAVATSCGGKLFVSSIVEAGEDKNGCIQCYDPITDHWQVLNSSLALLYSSLCVCNEKLYLIGGWDPVEREGSQSVICFDPKTTTWSKCEPMEEARVSPEVTVIANKIFVFGGNRNPYFAQAISSMEVYDPETNKWLGTKKMRREISRRGCVTLNIPARMILKHKAATW